MKYYVKLYHNDREKYFLLDTDKAMNKIEKATGSKWLGLAMGLVTFGVFVLPVINQHVRGTLF
jgi:hypothetical protein